MALSTDKEIAKEVTVAFIARLNVVNLNEIEETAQKVGKSYKAIFQAVSEAETPRPKIQD